MQKLRFTLLFVLLAFFTQAQKQTFQGHLQSNDEYTILHEQFKQFQVYQIDASNISDYLQTDQTQMRIELNLGAEHNWDLLLGSSDLRSRDYIINQQTANGIVPGKPMPNKAFNGHVQGPQGGTTALTVDQDFLYGFVEKNKDIYFIEPLHYQIRGAAKDLFLVYAKSEVIDNKHRTCGAHELEENKHYFQQRKHKIAKEVEDDLEKISVACYDLELAIASDFSMYQKYGSTIAGVENHNIGVMNNVQTNYDDEFTHNINFVIVTQFISTCNTCDPWTASTDPFVLLPDFRSWGNGGGFGGGITFDLASHWTDRNFDGGTVGLAYVGVLCGNSRYHVLEDFSSTAWALRVLTAHEIGHNLDAVHDGAGSGFIMAPSVNNSNTWSAASVADINAHIAPRITNGCLSPCGSGVPPVAGFSANVQSGCAPLTVNFTDLSTDATGWLWTFEGGTPGTSTQQNPTVSYPTAGDFDVTLEVTNSFGNDIITQTDYIVVDDVPEVSFTQTSNELIADFVNTSTNANSFLWDFGDGNTSTNANPTHVYDDDGEYVVTLTAFNNCGQNQVTEIVVIVTTPFALFTSDQTTGCAPLTVQYINQSSDNVTSYSWSFPGGTPNSSTEASPVVEYNTPGFYDVELTVGNAAGTDTYTELSYIEVIPLPTANFSFTMVTDVEVQFTNTSTNADSYLWDFGDGNTSSDENPTHTYAAAGSYDVTLISSNPCDAPSVTMTVVIVPSVPPVANFEGDTIMGCVVHVVEFMDLSTDATSWSWTFPGGDPATSTNEDPKVTYNNAGTYDVTLIATNATGSDTITFVDYIVIDDVPDADFTPVVTGGSVDFLNSTTNADTYLWDFGDGNSSTDENPNNVYATDGTYTVELIATNDCGNDTTEQTVTIVLPPIADFTSDVTMGCADLTVNFSDQSTTNATSWSWVFTGGTPATSTAQNPTVVYATAGTYTVELTVSNSAGSNTFTQTSYITVDDVPVADFNTTQTGNDVNFNNSSTNAVSYAWTFGDGNVSTDANPSNTYPGDGDYTVQLIATNTCGNDTLEQNITISTLPVAAFTANTTDGCVDLTVNYTDQSSLNATSWLWTFEGGDPATSTDQNPSVVYDTPGTYDVTLTVTNAAGNNTTTETDYITVGDVPSAGFTNTVNGLDADFTNTSTDANSYAWDFGDSNSSTATDPSHTYDMDGTYTVELTATNDCGTDVSTQTVVIATPPVAGFSSGATSGCADFTIDFTDESSANAVSWAWTFQGGSPATSTDQNPSVEYTTAGTYDVTLTVTNAAGTTNTISETAYVEIEEGPEADFTSSTSGMDVDFTNTSTNADSYNWDFGDGNMSTDENPTNTYAADGTYTVELTVTNDCGTDVTTETVVISNAPVAGFDSNITSGCADLIINFTNESSANTTSWNWTFEGGNPSSSTDENPTVTYSTAGTYNVELTVSNAAGATNTVTQTAYVTVADVPSTSFTSTVDGADVDFNNTSTDATSYSWDFGDGNGSTDENPSHSYDTDGTYTVELTATNDCGSITSTETITIVTPPSAGFTADVTAGCGPLTVSFTDQSSSNTTAWNWTFEGGTPATSTMQSPTVTFAAPGTYTVSLEASNSAGGNTATQMDYIVVAAGPTAAFATTTNGTLVDFNNNSTNATTYNWTFGDGNVSTDSNPSNTYATDGTYTVTLTAVGDCGTDVTTQTVTIVTPPIADFSANILQGCVPLSVDFSDLSTANATEWSWTFAGGTPATSTLQNPTVVYNTPGVYTVELEVSNSAGSNTVMKTSYIVVNAQPTASFGSTVAGTTANFNNSSTNATSYSWNFGDGGISSDTNPSYTYAADGTYTVTLTATNDCGSVTTTETVTISTEPVAGFASDVTTGCGPLTVNFTDGSSPNTTSWAWTFEGANPTMSNEQNPTVVFTNPGSYSVTLVASSASGSNTFTQTSYITVLSAPSAGFTSSTTGTTSTFSNTTTGGSTYLWNFGDGGMSVEPNPQHTYATDGTYTVTMTATNDCGSETVTETVVIVTPPTAGFSANITTGCAPLTVNFIDESSANATEWLWDFGNGTPATSTDQNPTVVYDTPGVYAVTLQVSNPAGTNTASQTSYIVVEAGPTADFTATQAGATIDFDNTSTNGDSYSWDFGDGNMSSMEDPTHTYMMSGTFTVTLTTTNDCGSVTATEQVTISITSAPVAAFSSDVTSGCAPLTVNYTDQSSGNTTSWAWTFEGGTPAASTDQNPQVVYNTPGTYNVTLTAMNSAGENTATQNGFIVVTDAAPTADFDSSISGTTVNFDNTSIGATSYAWTFGDGGMSAMENPMYTYSEDGTYEVTLEVTNDCGTSQTTETIVIATLPTAGFSMDVNSGCAPLTVSFTDESSSNTVSWEWTFPGGTPATSSDQNPVIAYGTPGTYDVTLVVTNAQGSDTQVQMSSIIIETAPIAGFMASGAGLTIDFTSTSTDGDTYAWTFGDGGMSMEENPSHEYTSGGDYDVELIVTNSCGSDTTSQVVTIGGDAPTASFTGTPISGCVPMEVEFTDQSTGATSWVWAFEGGAPETSTDQNPTVIYDTPGSYAVTLSVTNAFGSNSVTQVGYITVGEPPVANFTTDTNAGTTDFTNTSTGGDTYSWDFGDGGMSDEENPSYTYSENGDYTVVLTVTNECGSNTFTEVVSIMITSTTLPPSVSSFDFYPNPNNGSFYLEIEAAPTPELEVMLYDVIGRRMMVETFDFNTGQLNHHFEMTHLVAGTYVLQLRFGEDVVVRKVIVE